MEIPSEGISILIADDDADDRFLFGIALNEINIPHRLSAVVNGHQLMHHLKTVTKLPDVLILDLNMPMKNGNECLIEIKNQKRLELLPVVIYSTSLQDEIADLLYQNGAHYYLQKTDIGTLVPYLTEVLQKIYNGETARPPRSKFIVNAKQVRSSKYI